MTRGADMAIGKLTPGQEDYFRTLERLDISDDFRRSIEDTKNELREENATIVRGESRVKGFTRNDD